MAEDFDVGKLTDAEHQILRYAKNWFHIEDPVEDMRKIVAHFTVLNLDQVEDKAIVLWLSDLVHKIWLPHASEHLFTEFVLEMTFGPWHLQEKPRLEQVVYSLLQKLRWSKCKGKLNRPNFDILPAKSEAESKKISEWMAEGPESK